MRVIRQKGWSGNGGFGLTAAIATSGISFNVTAARESFKKIDLCLSSFKRWPDGGDCASMRLQMVTRSTRSCESLVELLKESIGGSWSMQQRQPCADIPGDDFGSWLKWKDETQLDHCQVLSGFVKRKHAFNLCASILEQLDSVSAKTEEHKRATALSYRLGPPLLAAKNLEQVTRIMAVLVPNERFASVWNYHMRVAGVSEHQITLMAPYIIIDATDIYLTEKISIRDAIKKALTRLSNPLDNARLHMFTVLLAMSAANTKKRHLSVGSSSLRTGSRSSAWDPVLERLSLRRRPRPSIFDPVLEALNEGLPLIMTEGLRPMADFERHLKIQLKRFPPTIQDVPEPEARLESCADASTCRIPFKE